MAFETSYTAKELNLYKDVEGNGNDLTAADYEGQKANGKTWKLLKQKHICYEERKLNVRKEALLFSGGFQMNEPDIASLFCPQLRNEEGSEIYKERIRSAAYIPTMGKLIIGLISNLFSQDLAVIEAADHNDPETTGEEYTDPLRNFYKEFQYNCDGHGTTLHDFFRKVTQKGLTHTRHYFGVDYPKGEATNLLDQEQMGLDKPKLYHIHSDNVWDFKFKEGSTTEYEWIKIGYCEGVQLTAYDPPMQKFCVKTLFMEEDKVCWEVHRSKAFPLDIEPKPKDIIFREEFGTISFKKIPIICYEVDEGIAVGEKLAPMAAEAFNRRTLENHSTNKACLTIPVVYRGGMLLEGDSIPDMEGSLPDRGSHPRGRVNAKGIVELGEYNKDKFEIVEAEGKALGFIHSQNEDLDEKMHSVVHQMGQSLKQSKSQSGRTALSKQEDRRSTEMLLTSIADSVYAVVERMFDMIADSRDEDIVFDAKGLSSIAQADRLDMVQEVLMLPMFKSPSITFTKEYYYRLMSDMTEGLDQRTLATIRKETEETFDKEGHEDYMGVSITNPTQDQESKQQLQDTKPVPAAPSSNKKGKK